MDLFVGIVLLIYIKPMAQVTCLMKLGGSKAREASEKRVET